MSSFPLCVEMKNSTVFLVGEGKAAEEKLQKLLLFEANICLFSESGFTDFQHPQVQRIPRKLTEQDLKHRPLFVVVAANDGENHRISTLCREHNIPVNVVDVPEFCSFTFPALIKRGAVTISINTGGKSPALAAQLRQKLESSLPDDLDAVLEQLSLLRQKLKEEEADPEKRKLLLKQAAEKLLSK